MQSMSRKICLRNKRSIAGPSWNPARFSLLFGNSTESQPLVIANSDMDQFFFFFDASTFLPKTFGFPMFSYLPATLG